MFGVGFNEIFIFGIWIVAVLLGILILLLPYFVYRISINVAGMRETLDGIYEIIEGKIDIKNKV